MGLPGTGKRIRVVRTPVTEPIEVPEHAPVEAPKEPVRV